MELRASLLRHGRSSVGVLAGIALVAVAAVMAFYMLRKPPPVGLQVTPEVAFEQTRVALAATEAVDWEAAVEAWQRVLEGRPGDGTALQNAALAHVGRVEALRTRLFEGGVVGEERVRAAEDLTNALDAARDAIDAFAGSQPPMRLLVWMRATVASAEAYLLEGPARRARRTEVFLELSDDVAVVQDPTILIGPLAELATQLNDPVDGLPERVDQRYPEVLVTAADKAPDNLFVVMEALTENLRAEKEVASRLLDRVAELTAALSGLLDKFNVADRDFLKTQLALIRKQIDAGNWDATRVPWRGLRNVLKPTEVVRTDRRRANPSPLDLISFAGLRELSGQVAEARRVEVAATPLRFQRVEFAEAPQATSLTESDVDLDGIPEVLTLHEGLLTVLQFENQTLQPLATAQVSSEATHVLVADLFMVDASDPGRIRRPRDAKLTTAQAAAVANEHDTYPSILVYGPTGIEILRFDGRKETATEERLKPPRQPTGLEDLRGVTAVAAGDFEGDGDLDLVIATADRRLGLWVNRGNMTFFDVSGDTQLPPTEKPIQSLAIGDIDRDLDLDFLAVLSESGEVKMLENLLHLQFRFRDLEAFPTIANGSSLAVEEIDGDVSWDLVAAGGEQLSIAMTETIAAGQFRIAQTRQAEASGSCGVVADFNNDSWLDWITAGESPVQAFAIGPAETKPLEIDAEIPETTTAMWHADFDRDGRIDLVGIADGRVWLAMNQTADVGHYLNVQFRGRNDNNERSGRINHFGIGSVLELRYGPHYRAKIITDRDTHFGLDGYETVDMVRIILPNGITQNATNPPVDQTFVEVQTLKGSCPYLYSWDGQRFAFVTDCLWAAPLGLQVSSNRVAPDRPWEYLKVPGELVQPRDGTYELRITEELWEAVYLDHVALLAVDHPADVEIWTNEKVGPASIAEPKIHTFAGQHLRSISKAVDTRGKDVTAKLKAADEDFVKGFDYRIRQGLCPPHWIDLDLGEVAAGDRVLLVLTGWILPTDTSLNIQIDQNPELPSVEPPSVWIPDGESWKQVMPFMGFPGGKTKTIVVDVSEFLRPEDPRVRIRTSAQIYWDRAAVAINPPDLDVPVHACQLRSAELTWHGFSQRLKAGPLAPETYDYHRTSDQPRWPPLRGRATRYGDVLGLLTAWDDQMVVMGSGDEARLRFAVPQPPPPEGWKRDFVLHSVGWDKDADLNTLAGQSFEPLPFRGMEAYPPPRAQMDEAERVAKENDSHRGRRQPFRRFWSRPLATGKD